MARTGTLAETAEYIAPNDRPAAELAKLHQLTTVCIECGAHRSRARFAGDQKPGREMECIDCGHTGRVKTNEHGGVEMLTGFRVGSGGPQ